jgi:hypothetical protein
MPSHVSPLCTSRHFLHPHTAPGCVGVGAAAAPVHVDVGFGVVNVGFEVTDDDLTVVFDEEEPRIHLHAACSSVNARSLAPWAVVYGRANKSRSRVIKSSCVNNVPTQ